MIHGVLILTESGDPVLVRYYDELQEGQREIIQKKVMFYVHLRHNVSNIIYNDIGMEGCHIVYKHYADKYFVLVVDDVESDIIDLSLLFCMAQSVLHCLGSFDTETMLVQT